MKLSNNEMYRMLESLVPLLEYSGIVGYVAARNYRKLQSELTEYNEKRAELFEKYGESENGTYSISIESENFRKFDEEITPYAMLESEIDLLTIPISEAEQIKGKELIEAWWMFYDEE